VSVVEAYGGGFGMEPGLIERELEAAGVTAVSDKPRMEAATPEQVKAAMAVVREKTLAIILLSGANRGRYQEITNNLANVFTLGEDKYPTSIKAVMTLLNKYVMKTSSTPRPSPSDEKEEMAFMEQGQQEKAATKKKAHKKRKKAAEKKAKDAEKRKIGTATSAASRDTTRTSAQTSPTPTTSVSSATRTSLTRRMTRTRWASTSSTSTTSTTTRATRAVTAA